MSDDGRMTVEDLEMVGEYLDGQGMSRGDLLKRGAALGLAAAGVGAAASKAGAAVSAGATQALEKRFGWMIAANVPFFEQTMTRWMRRALRGTGYSLVTQSEDGSAVKAQQIMTNMIQQEFAFIMKADGVPPKPFEPLAKQAKQKGIFFMNHAVQAVGGSGQNIAFDHAAAGKGIGTAAVRWARKNGISQPVIGTLANLADPEGRKRTDFAIREIKKAFPNTKVAGQVQSVDQVGQGAAGTANLLQANPDINMILTFNTVTGKEATQASREAGKTNRNEFFLGMADYEEETMNLVASGKSIVQANWAAIFEISAILMIRDGLKFAKGGKVPPTRGLGGRLLTNAREVAAVRKVTNNPLAKSALPAYNDKTIVKYSNKPLKTGQSINTIFPA
jgi:ABC-type sugar transport system substrate-binding protein